MTDFGAARPSDLYTAENPAAAGGPEPFEVPEAPSLDARIAEAQADLSETQRELAELLAPRPEETGAGVLGNLLRFCDRVTEGIAGFFSSLFGSRELPAGVKEAEIQAVLQRLDLQRDHLEELQVVRAEMVEVRSRLQDLQQVDPDLLLPQAQQFRTELSPIADLFQEFAWTPVLPGGPSASPSLDGTPALDLHSSWRPFQPESSPLFEVRERVVGDPVEDAAYWHLQSGDMTCAIVDQEMILDKLAGHPDAAHEFTLLQEAIANGWARPDGATSPAHVGYLLNERGIPTEVVLREEVSRLAERLAAGQEAIVGVRGEILWNLDSAVESGSDLNPANHAIWVTGATVVERNGTTEVVSVYINDSGDPNGRGREVPVELFLRAWAASDNHVIYAMPGQR